MPDDYEGEIVVGEILTGDGPPKTGVPTVKYVHYAGAQQLILWLPQSGYHGYGELTVARGDDVIEQASVRSRLNGSIQIIWDTLPWSPGDYTIAIPHDEGWRHEVRLRKYHAGEALPSEPTPEAAAEEEPRGPIVYRDGFGNVIPDLDLDIRAHMRQEVGRRFARRLEYEGTFRAGTVVYIDGAYRIAFSNEMCGEPMKCSIDVPTAAHWEMATGAPLSMRDEIITFVAERVQREQASSWRYEITDRSIDFY